MLRSTLEIAFVLFLIALGLILVFSSGGSESNPVSRAVFSVMRPVHQTIHYVRSSLVGGWKSYVALTGVKEENDKLRNEISDLKRERSVLLNTDKENLRLRKLLNFKTQNDFPAIAAQVVGEDSVGLYRTLLVGRGTDDGIQARMPVAVAEGVVGRVATASSKMSQVILVTDPDLSIDCRVLRTRDRGVLSGSLESGCVVRYLDLKSQVAPGDEIVSSGLDGIFPRGLLLGKVKSIADGTYSLFREAVVTPSVDFSSLEEVLVILKIKGGFDIRPGLDYKR
jgi:rod shape-determining protein MreC